MLCSACQSAFRGPLIFDDSGYSEGIVHHLTAQSFSEAVRQGCYICSSMFQQYQGDKTNTLGPQRLLEGIEGSEYYFSTKYSPRYPTLWLLGYESNIKVYSSSYPLVEADLCGETRHFASNTASEPCWKLAKQWLSSCLTDHKRCTKNLSAIPYHPTRLIEVTSCPSHSNDELHLRIPGEHSPDVPYMTLSHRWGKSQFLRLTKVTSQRLRDGFSGADTLSKTFQDAITICQELGVRYLWIDSLCIFQDSLEDWRYEAAQMGQTYGNSLCNIAATGASNDEEGCFRDRDASLLQQCTIKSEWDDRDNKIWEIIDERFWDTRINQAPLNQRGWVMQERWLSPRVLHYGRDQILWECSEFDACETYPDGLPKPLRNQHSGFKLDTELVGPLGYWRQTDAATPDPDLLVRGIWSGIVGRYSVTSLTKGEDKLVAISGIAKRLQGLFDDEYLAGLWRKSLPSQLLWSVERSEVETNLQLTRPRPYRAPSWSWASVDQKVNIWGWSYDGILITILDAVVSPVGPDSTGQIKDGFIRLNGRILLAELLITPVLQKPHADLRMSSEDLKGLCILDTQLQAIDTTAVYFLPIRSHIYENKPWIEGLLLQPAARGNGTYERIGVYNCMGEKSCSVVNQSQTYKDKSLYENADGETIVLI